MQLRVVDLLIISTFPIAGLVFYTLSLTGCVSESPGLSSIFLVAIRGSTAAELRIGYFGVCMAGNSTRVCAATPYSTNPQSLHAALVSQYRQGDGGSSIPSISTLETALQLQRSIFFCVQAFAGVLFVISILLFAARVGTHISKGQGRSWRFIEQGWSEKVLLLSVSLSAISATSIMQTGNALQFATAKPDTRSLHIKVGSILQVLQWLAFAFSATLCMVAMRRAGQRTPGNPTKGEKLPTFVQPPSSSPLSLPRGPQQRRPPMPPPPPPP